MVKLTLNENLFTPLNEDVTLVSDEKKEKAEALADYLGIDKKDIRYYPYEGHEDRYFLEDGTEYLVCTDEEATELAKNYIADILDTEGIGVFTQDFIDTVIDKGYIDLYWFDDAQEEFYWSYINDIELEGGDYANRLIDELVEDGIIDEDDLTEDGNIGDDVDIDKIKEKYVNNLCNNYFNPIEWYKDSFGTDGLMEVIKNHNLLDYGAVADLAIDWDGRAHFLNTYDGDELELSNDYYAYKIGEDSIDGYDSAYEIFDDGDKLEERVNWISFDKFDKIKDRYVHGSGEGDTMAQQMISAVKNIVDSWYRDGNVYDNSYELGGNRKDISTFANWLYTYIPETKQILDGIKNVKNGEEYEDLLDRLYSTIYQDSLLNKYSNEEAIDSIFDCSGNPFVHNSINESIDLKEKAWKKTLNPKIAMKLRNAIRSGDIPKIKEALKEAFIELYRISPDDFYDGELDEKIEDIDFIDDDDEEEIDGILERFYDICDDLSIWIPISESMVKEAKSPFVHKSINESTDRTKDFVVSIVLPYLDTEKNILDVPINFNKEIAPRGYSVWGNIRGSGFFEGDITYKGRKYPFKVENGKLIVYNRYDLYQAKYVGGKEYTKRTAPKINEDTIKTKDGKWANVGKDGKVDSGKFRTKKEADAQRKAMYANWK